MDARKHCVFEYLYRDAGNFKARGRLLLEGVLAPDEVERLKERLFDREYFIAEQLNVPTPYEQLWDECGSEPSKELDHVWHEFSCVREASADDISQLDPWGPASRLLFAVENTSRWDESLSRNWEL
jgi:hypothetical protein